MKPFMVLVALVFPSVLVAQTVVSICGDAAGFPPYTYSDTATSRVQGATVDILTAIFEAKGYTVVIDLLPWKRALQEADSGKKYAMVIDATENAERRETYWITDPLYQIHSALYYAPDHFPQPPVITTSADLTRFQFGGIQGYNYSMYDIPTPNINFDAKDEKARFAMLRAGRFDFALADVEVLQGFVMAGELDLSGLQSVPVPGFQSKPYYALISRHRPDGEKLRRLINEGLAALHHSGAYAQILAKYHLATSGR